MSNSNSYACFNKHHKLQTSSDPAEILKINITLLSLRNHTLILCHSGLADQNRGMRERERERERCREEEGEGEELCRLSFVLVCAPAKGDEWPSLNSSD